MDQISKLVEQRIRESELQLKHVDELMGKAGVPMGSQLAELKVRRDQAARQLDVVRSQSHAARDISHAEGVKGVLETIGLELEKALLAVFERDKSH
ncbi:MAG TPA: hypothetical protein VFM48_11175 [Aquabacterium sp.]|nr:hypothetical protein [Aquabacterium sp.]